MSDEINRPCMSFSLILVSIARTMKIGATSVATELNVIATTAAMKGRFSLANSGINFRLDSRKDVFCRGPFTVSSVYFIVARAALGVVELDIFRRSLHQFLMLADGQDFAFHQQNDLVIVDH